MRFEMRRWFRIIDVNGRVRVGVGAKSFPRGTASQRQNGKRSVVLSIAATRKSHSTLFREEKSLKNGCPPRRAAAPISLDSLPGANNSGFRQSKGASEEAAGRPRRGERRAVDVVFSRLRKKLLSQCLSCFLLFFCLLCCSFHPEGWSSFLAPPTTMQPARGAFLAGQPWSAFARCCTYREKHEQQRTWRRCGARKQRKKVRFGK